LEKCFLMMRRSVLFCVLSVLIPVFLPAQGRYDVLITEFLPDPSPAVGLPQSSFVELKNRSLQDFNLRGWKISNGNTSVTIKTDFLLKSDSFLILCAAADADAYTSFGATLGVTGFPALDNDAGEIILVSSDGSVIHAVQYDKSWFNNEVKATGGWSLEMIDPDNPCGGKSNWTASISAIGGTPGKKNSVDAKNTDDHSPSLVRALATDSLNLLLFFDKPLDSLTSSSNSNYSTSGGIGQPQTATAQAPFFDQVVIHLATPMAAGKIYTISVQSLYDCSGNEIGLSNTCKAGLAEPVKNGDIIFNEILFNPPPYGYDYIELFNRSPKIISGLSLYVGGRDIDGSIKDPVAIVKGDRAFFPGEYLLITENTDWILHNYLLAPPNQLVQISPLPSMPDDAGKVVLLNGTGDLIDELDYDHNWHSPLLANQSGVSLERIQADQPTNLAGNWTSAAADAGFGTPGYKNSESGFTDGIGSNEVFVDPKIFSPDQDGYHDFCFVQYHFPAGGFTGNISIYDVSGRLVRSLVNNILLSTSGNFRWDGLDDQQNLLPVGVYIIVTEIFNLQGKTKIFRNTAVLARKK
jgi:hypothetical protein